MRSLDVPMIPRAESKLPVAMIRVYARGVVRTH
jgi:hypothetical protein